MAIPILQLKQEDLLRKYGLFGFHTYGFFAKDHDKMTTPDSDRRENQGEQAIYKLAIISAYRRRKRMLQSYFFAFFCPTLIIFLRIFRCSIIAATLSAGSVRHSSKIHPL